EQWELCQQVGFDAFAGFVTWPQFVAKRFDNVIGRNSDVRGTVLDHAQHRREDASDRGYLPPIRIPCGRQCVIVPEQFVCAVDQMDVQSAAPLRVAEQLSRNYYAAYVEIRTLGLTSSPSAKFA